MALPILQTLTVKLSPGMVVDKWCNVLVYHHNTHVTFQGQYQLREYDIGNEIQ